ncbi:hypothetical protein EG68_03893 [Paragonimus skrjabini miyazakii]|uniref:Uncharacterized protein n=1 Tax=Paragonimus skrjabini miyazakii TaxID=59628 RepID=A0A8S9YVA3_9TREM|nr:hypothetical protein EG68_03893 [Paragonimus skrjabini miyazakii]
MFTSCVALNCGYFGAEEETTSTTDHPTSRNQNGPLHSPKPIRHASSAHSLFIPSSFLGTDSSSPDIQSGNRTLHHTDRTRPISHPSSRDSDSVGSPMGPDSTDEPRGAAPEEARGDRCSRELHLRPDAVAFAPLPIDLIRGSAGRHFHTRLVDSQRRARSTLQLHQPQQQQQHHYHQPASRKRWPSHILNELVADISRSSSMFSLDSSTTSSSDSVLAGLSTSDLHTPPCVQRLNSDNPSIVTPSAPKTFIIASTNQENSSKTKPSSTRLIIEHDTSKNSDAHELRNSSPLAKMERIDPGFDPTPSTSSFLNPWSHDPLGRSRQHSVTRISSPAIPSHLSQADSLDYFMQDAALRFREKAYDPYGLVRKNLGDSLNGRSVASVISFTNASSGNSQASSGQFSLMSTRSFSCTRTFDRRRRTKQTRIAR